MMIFVYWGILILCYFIASRLRSMASRFGFLDKSMMAAVYILVFLMGLRMGINQQVTSALATIGVQALAITLATIGGSILMIFLVRKGLRLNRYGGSEKDAQEQEHRGKAGTSDLKSTVGIVSLVIAGIAVGRFGLVAQFPDHLDEISNITGNGLTIFLCVLIAIIGFDLGLSGTVAANLKSVGLKVLAFPLAILAGTMLAGGGAAMAFGFSLKESIAICAGFGWYSYAPAIITAAGPQYAVAGAVAFLHNVMRETAGIIFIPLVARKLGYLEAISIPGIGTMDVCMPIVEQSCRQDTVVYGFVSGFLLCIFTSFSVPFLMG